MCNDLSLEVLQQDIDKANDLKGHPEFVVAASCPTAQALMRMGYTDVVVGPENSYAWRDGERGCYKNPPALREQINAWDFEGTFSPIKVVMEKHPFLAGF